MEHMGIDSGTASIFDDVDKSDFKADFGSEFPVGLTSFFVHAFDACACCLLLPLNVLPCPWYCLVAPLTTISFSIQSLLSSVLVHCLLSLISAVWQLTALLCFPWLSTCTHACTAYSLLPFFPLPSAYSERCVLLLNMNKYAKLPTSVTSRSSIDTVCFSSDSCMFWLCLSLSFSSLIGWFCITFESPSFFLWTGPHSVSAWTPQTFQCNPLAGYWDPCTCHSSAFNHMYACWQCVVSPFTSSFSLFSLSHWNRSSWFLCHSSMRSVEIVMNHDAFFPWLLLVWNSSNNSGDMQRDIMCICIINFRLDYNCPLFCLSLKNLRCLKSDCKQEQNRISECSCLILKSRGYTYLKHLFYMI